MRVLLGVTGGIAAYKALEFTRLAMKAGHAVRVVQTEAAQRFVGAASFAGITGAPVIPAKEAGPTKRCDASVWITRTWCPARMARRVNSIAL